MKNRLSQMAKSMLCAMCFLLVGGAFNSCTDDYEYDDKAPNFLGQSIYNELKKGRTIGSEKQTFQTLVRLIDDLDYADVLAKTANKTVFAATDAAFEKFFQTNEWGVRSYEELTDNQKKFLFKNCMLDNPYLLEMLSNASIQGVISKNQCLRRGTAFQAVDTIPFWKNSELPTMYNEPMEGENALSVTSDQEWWGGTDFWEAAKDPENLGLYMAVDGTSGMMTHFLEGVMLEKGITYDDLAFILNKRGQTLSADDSYVYNRRIIDGDIVCVNGYIHVLDSVLIPPSSMAEEIRKNKTTSYFSAMLDRFSAPYVNNTLTQNYGSLHNIGENTKVYEKLYVSQRAGGQYAGSPLTLAPNGRTLASNFPQLVYDPSWNQYSVSSSTAKEQDMAAMFVPSNDAMWAYFMEGSGRILMERFAKETPVTRENFLYNLYQIPLDIMQSLINNLMKTSFIESVPSKWKTIMNDAQDQMFSPSQYTDATYRDLFDKVILANNGAVYVMNTVISPADYASVIAPALYSNNTQIMKTLVQADDNFIEGSSAFANAPLQKYYSTYLKAMQSNFTFFIPVDEGLENYGIVDPFMASLQRNSTTTPRLRYYSFAYKKPKTSSTTGKVIPIEATPKRWTPSAARNFQTDGSAGVSKITETSTRGDNATGDVKTKLLTEMVDHHIVVHSKDEADGVQSAPNWYLSRNGAPVYMKSKGSDIYGSGMVVDGGFQIMQNSDDVAENDEDCNVVEGYDQTGINRSTGEKNYGNGMSYLIDRPMQATLYSVYHILNADPRYSEFLKQCDNVSVELLKRAGFDMVTADSAMAAADWTKEQGKFYIFKQAANNFFTPANEPLVRFFNNYNYTIYAPTNEAMQRAYADGLPTWEQIEQFVEENHTDSIYEAPDPDHAEEVAEYQANVQARYEKQQQAMAMCTTLLNFLKYHFQDHSIFVDNVNKTDEYQTSCVDNATNTYIMINAAQSDGSLVVTDNAGRQVEVVAPYNLLANDMEFSHNVRSATYTTPGRVKVNSYVVIHTVDEYLNFESSGTWSSNKRRFDGAWKTPATAKAFVKKYRIRK